MPRNRRHDPLFEPVQIGPKLLHNRFYQVPFETGFGVLKPWSAARYRAIRAEGGWAAVCTGFAPISPEGDTMPAGRTSRMWDDGDRRALALMCQEVHDAGALAGIELHHGGVHQQNEARWPAVAPSQLAGDSDSSCLVIPKQMLHADIERVQADWVAAALRSVEAGFDIVYVYGAHSFLPMQFLSPFYNQRTDEYGGSLQNRARFALELLAQLRDAVGDRCALAYRIAVDDFSAATVAPEDALAFVRLADGLVDLWDVNVSSISEWSKDAGLSGFFPQGHQLEWSRRVREISSKPVVGVGRWTDPDQMAEAIRRRDIDIIGAARPSIADPFLPRKIGEGKLDDIRECIGGNQCIARSRVHQYPGCTQNATAGEEHRRGWHPERYAKATNTDNDVLVIGAGPAGMECAIVLGRRGMRRVHLIDRADEPGGHLNWLARLPRLGEWSRVVNYRQIQLRKLRNVEVLLGVEMDADSAREYGADIVVVATGSRWAHDGRNGISRGPLPGAVADGASILTPEQVVAGGARPDATRVVVYDTDGYLVGPGLAELLRSEDYEVEYVSPYRSVAPMAWALDGNVIRHHLHAIGVRERLETRVTQVVDQQVEIANPFGEPATIDGAALVLVTQRVSDDSLYLNLLSDPAALTGAEITAVRRVGDCVTPRWLADTIFDGHRLGREIDSLNPDVPLPYAREGFHDLEATPRADAEPETASVG